MGGQVFGQTHEIELRGEEGSHPSRMPGSSRTARPQSPLYATGRPQSPVFAGIVAEDAEQSVYATGRSGIINCRIALAIPTLRDPITACAEKRPRWQGFAAGDLGNAVRDQVSGHSTLITKGSGVQPGKSRGLTKDATR